MDVEDHVISQLSKVFSRVSRFVRSKRTSPLPSLLRIKSISVEVGGGLLSTDVPVQNPTRSSFKVMPSLSPSLLLHEKIIDDAKKY